MRGESRVGFGWTVYDCCDQGFGTRQFESEMLKRGGNRDINWTDFDVLFVYYGYATTTTSLKTWSVNVSISRGCGLIK